ncbi:hypothetical protein B0H16DRAFT_1570376 [Mycena metata]|uniref:Uncharacterized protein n=1 Tax=Mycena metata TaxID=1033252 RepID=A0AAD7ICE4_9AGAR|nr:hypothetical protein B0H16DRAFT_1570376 [Mycena metata]
MSKWRWISKVRTGRGCMARPPPPSPRSHTAFGRCLLARVRRPHPPRVLISDGTVFLFAPSPRRRRRRRRDLFVVVVVVVDNIRLDEQAHTEAARGPGCPTTKSRSARPAMASAHRCLARGEGGGECAWEWERGRIRSPAASALAWDVFRVGLGPGAGERRVVYGASRRRGWVCG